MTTGHMGIMCFAGSIRGAIAFGLAISIDANSQINRDVFISTTLILVFFTTIVFGALMPWAVKFFSKKERLNVSFLDRSNDEIMEKYQIARYEDMNMNKSSQEDSIMRSCWIQLDNKYFKPFLIEDWPNVKKDHNIISVKIIKLFEEHQKEKLEEKKKSSDKISEKSIIRESLLHRE
jgi:hypothetical protein